MAKKKKVRAFQIAEQLSMSFKEFSEYAKCCGQSFRSAQNSIELEAAKRLVYRIKEQLKSKENQNVYRKDDVENKDDYGFYAQSSMSEQERNTNHILSSRETINEDNEALVQFTFLHEHSYPGDEIGLVGDLPALGEWNTSKALLLKSNEWPLWKTSLHLPKGVTFEYKLFIKNQKGLFWESGENRQCSTNQLNGGLVQGSFR